MPRRPSMERSPEEAAAPPPLLDDEGEIRRAEANGFDLFVGNMGAEVDEALLTHVFSQFASFVLGSARVKRNTDGTTRCYGYVTFAQRRDAEAARAEFDDRLVGTRPVRLSVCRRWSDEARRRLTPEQLMARCEMRKLLFQEQIRRNGGLPSRGAPPLTYYSALRY